MKMKTKRFNWRVSEEMAAELSVVRRESGFRSWDEFFRTMLQKFDRNSTASPARLESRNLKLVAAGLNSHRESLRKILGILESRDGLFSELQAGLEEVQQTLSAIRGLLGLALGENEKPVESPAMSEGGASKLRQRLEKRGKA